MAYDVIGDIHGCSQSLTSLLDRLEYKRDTGGVFRHAKRKAVFLGDFIDRGPFQREVLDVVRPMIENDCALAVMGNHEFNAIAYHTQDPDTGSYLRPHTDKNTRQHQAFLDAYGADARERAEVVEWFNTLPLWLDLDDFRVVHACWDKHCMQKIQDMRGGSNLLSEALLRAGSQSGTWQYAALETLLKGKEIPLKPGLSFKDKDGHTRHHIRIRWWDQAATSYRSIYMGPESARSSIPDDDVEGDHLVEYGHAEPPCFLGHYWMEGQPGLLAPNIACLDFSVAKPGGKLVAYRWDGERTLSSNKFVWVDRKEEG